MKYNKAIRLLEVRQACAYISDSWRAENPQQGLKIANDTISGRPISSETRMLYYMKSICLDMMNRPDEALPIIKMLTERYPKVPTFQRSYLVINDNLRRLAAQKIVENKFDPQLQNFYDVLMANSFPSYHLTHAVAAIEAKKGYKEAAKKKMLALLALAPNDADYLRCSLDIAAMLDDTEWTKDLVSKVNSLIALYPYMVNYYKLIPEEAYLEMKPAPNKPKPKKVKKGVIRSGSLRNAA